MGTFGPSKIDNSYGTLGPRVAASGDDIYIAWHGDYPDFPLGYDALAVTLSKSGHAREAIPLHEKAISLRPDNPSFYYTSAVTYVMLGDLKNAEQQKQRLQSIDPAMAEHLAILIARRRR